MGLSCQELCASVCIMMHLKVKHQTYHYKRSQCCCRCNTPISRSRHFEIESEAPVGRNPEVTVNNNDLDYRPRAATAI